MTGDRAEIGCIVGGCFLVVLGHLANKKDSHLR